LSLREYKGKREVSGYLMISGLDTGYRSKKKKIQFLDPEKNSPRGYTDAQISLPNTTTRSKSEPVQSSIRPKKIRGIWGKRPNRRSG